MKKNDLREKIHLTSVDELFGLENAESSIEIEIDRIRSFKDHPFKVLDDDKMADLAESIRANGVLTPVVVRGNDGDGYEMVSGHRRLHASRLAGLKKIPAFVRELSDDEATIVMVDSNIQREELLPSEKAFALKMKLEALKRQGQRRPQLSADLLRRRAGRGSAAHGAAKIRSRHTQRQRARRPYRGGRRHAGSAAAALLTVRLRQKNSRGARQLFAGRAGV